MTWQPIETAPKDGTFIDLWSDDLKMRVADCYWGMPEHCCGEYGQYCDSDWHSLAPGWVESALNASIDDSFTHWMPLPAPPLSQE